MKQIKRLQIGKNGLTESFVEQIRKVFKNTEGVKISILKSACRDKKHAKEIANELVDKLGKNYTYKMVGYTFGVRKWRKDKR